MPKKSWTPKMSKANTDLGNLDTSSRFNPTGGGKNGSSFDPVLSPFPQYTNKDMSKRHTPKK